MEYMQKIARVLMDNPVLLIPMVTFVFSVIAEFTPSRSDDELMDRLWETVHLIAINPRSDKARPRKVDG